jgi:hypothetical protein
MAERLSARPVAQSNRHQIGVQVPPLQKLYMPSQTWQGAPPAPQAAFAVPCWHAVPSQHPAQQPPTQHWPPEQGVRLALFAVPQLPPLQVGSWHAGAVQVLHVLPPVPQALTAFPARHDEPFQQPAQQLPLRQVPPGQLPVIHELLQLPLALQLSEVQTLPSLQLLHPFPFSPQ